MLSTDCAVDISWEVPGVGKAGVIGVGFSASVNLLTPFVYTVPAVDMYLVVSHSVPRIECN